MMPADIVAAARDWKGVPFLHQGRSRHGVDCIGFIAAMCAELGISKWLELLPHNYARNPQAQLSAALHAHASLSYHLQPGIVLLIKWPKSEHASHCAIYTGESMIHSYQRLGAVKEHSYDEVWQRMTDSAWLIPGVNYS